MAKRQREDAEESKADKAAKKMRLEMRQRGHAVRQSSCRVAVEAEQTCVHGPLCSHVSFMTVVASWHKCHAAAHIDAAAYFDAIEALLLMCTSSNQRQYWYPV